ncbi:AAA family ATPase [Sulfurimonas sp.]|uniref:AAA family ATPase n=1 Tax=Sulfurimonas sp. TaxID=2022749 RepID=UPI002639EA3D|nr:AAA family ATPase [Sulfurimonas sp.]MDD5156843.1 AAA family ATPase [Sulfurimonas sp.]
MDDILTKIEEKIKKQQRIPELIEKIDLILLNKYHYLNDSEKEALQNERLILENDLLKVNITLEEKHKNFFYTYDDIKFAPKIKWLIPNLIPKGSIGVLIGPSGSGKTTLVVHLCSIILESFKDVYIIYIDGDMSVSKIKELGIESLMHWHNKRFLYAGKNSDYFSEASQNLLRDTVIEQKNNPERTYLVIEDSLTLTAKKKRGFIDTDYLYKYEKMLRDVGGGSFLVHHTNKAGVFADTQQIENFADYTYMIERNEFNSCILLHPQKASRYDIKGRAYMTKERKIAEEVDYDTFNISQRESKFVMYVIDALEDGEMNQSELLSYLEKVKFFSDYKVGQKKAIKWLQVWGDKGKWIYEQKPSEKNAIFYRLES